MARDNKISAEQSYSQTVESEAIALSTLNTKISNLAFAQSAVDGQTVVVATALTNKNNAQDALDVANINLQTAQSAIQNSGNQGVSFRIYPLSRSENTAYLSATAGLMCQGAISTFYTYAGDGAICGSSQNIIGIFNATLTVPAGINDVYFAAYTDDGSKIYVNGVLEASQWVEQGSTWGPYTRHFNTSTDKTLELEVWWYNGGGPGVMTIGWGYNNIWTGIPSSYLSYGSSATQQQTNAYNEALATQQAAQTNYNNKLSIYNSEVTTLNSLQDDLDQTQDENDNAQTAYETAQTNTASALVARNNAIEVYNQAIIDMNDAITAAEEEYIAQWDFEEKQRIAAAIATALANQPQPEPSVAPTPVASPDPTPEAPPTPAPSPEPTKEDPPTPAPTPEPTPEDKPIPVASPDPETSPAPTPEPTVEPSPEPLPEPTPEPTKNPEIKDKVLAALIPEKGTGTTEDLSGVIANLTSKDNKLVVLSPEQISAVSQTLKALTNEAKAEVAKDLGISASEVAKVADIMKSNPEIATAFVEFNDRAAQAGDTPMPFTLADATTEVQAEAFLADPLGALFNVDPLELLSNFSELGSDMTDDQREKAQEVIIPVVIVSQIASTIIGMRR